MSTKQEVNEALRPIATACPFCGSDSPPLPEGRECHAACAEAYGLDHNPESDSEARSWLDNRRRMLGMLPHWTNRAYAAVIVKGEYGIGLAEENKSGYFSCPELGTFPTYEEASAEAKRLNRALGLTEDRALRIVLSSMGKHTRKR